CQGGEVLRLVRCRGLAQDGDASPRRQIVDQINNSVKEAEGRGQNSEVGGQKKERNKEERETQEKASGLKARATGAKPEGIIRSGGRRRGRVWRLSWRARRRR